MKKFLFAALPLVFLAASCNFFSKPPTAGVVKTTNGGADWQFANLMKDSKTNLLAGANVSRLAFDPTNREVLYAATFTSGLFKSQDSAASWTQILSKISVYDMAVHPTDPNTLYAVGLYGGFGKVLKTQDGGKTWEEVYNEQGESDAVRAIAVNPQNPNQVAAGSATGNVVISSDGGLSWKQAYNFQDRVQRIVWQNGNIYVLLKNKGLSKSADGGQTFLNLTSGLSKVVDWQQMEYNTDAVRGFNQFFVDVYTGNLIYMTTDQGLYKTQDGGSTWQYVPLPVNKSAALARSIAVARSSSNIVYTSVGSTVYKTVDGGSTWQTQNLATPGSVNYLVVDPDLPQIAYAGIFLQQQ